MTTSDVLTITRPTDGDDAHRLIRRVINRHGTAMKTRPLLCHTERSDVWANAWALPFRCGSFAQVRCLDVLENVRDDEALVDELARVLAPGGRLLLRVPRAGPLAGLDPYNLYRYLVDITGRGNRSPEIDELGWRRHYSLAEIDRVLGSGRFHVSHWATEGIGGEQLTTFGGMVLFRWWRHKEPSYERVASLAERIGHVEAALPAGRFGFSLTVEAVRRSADRR
ncbi:MAG: class I SAM-dependent methyltransferase [Thermomicrobiales bacterium]